MRIEIIYKLITRVIQYFCFPDKHMKSGTSYKWGGGDPEKGVGGGGGMTPLTKYGII